LHHQQEEPVHKRREKREEGRDRETKPREERSEKRPETERELNLSISRKRFEVFRGPIIDKTFDTIEVLNNLPNPPPPLARHWLHGQSKQFASEQNGFKPTKCNQKTYYTRLARV